MSANTYLATATVNTLKLVMFSSSNRT